MGVDPKQLPTGLADGSGMACTWVWFPDDDGGGWLELDVLEAVELRVLATGAAFWIRSDTGAVVLRVTVGLA